MVQFGFKPSDIALITGGCHSSLIFGRGNEAVQDTLINEYERAETIGADPKMDLPELRTEVSYHPIPKSLPSVL